ncbi:MAG: ABC transporter substrate-binding protein [Crocinitomicaceae bacterium]|nr:ABC transporter substrate-binding protein [Crocinitomicaceae bacterium]
MLLVQDQTGHEVKINSTNRIVSIVPSQTELLVDLGCEDRLVGLTKFCVHPEGLIQRVGHVGGTKNLNLDKIRKLKPDLIIGNKEENTQEQIEELRKEFPVWMSDIYSVEDAFRMILSLGEILSVSEEANALVQEIEQERQSISNKPSFTALYFIWKNPNMIAGSHNFIHSMIREAGGVNLGEKIGERYPELHAEDLKEIPDYIFLSTEPYPFKESDIIEFKSLYPKSEVLLVDGEMFSWYGSRMRLAYSYFSKLTSR